MSGTTRGRWAVAGGAAFGSCTSSFFYTPYRWMRRSNLLHVKRRVHTFGCVCMGVPHFRPVAPCWLITPCGGNEIVCALVTFNLVYIFERSASAVADPTISFFFSTTGPVRLAVRSSASDTTIRVWRRETTSTGPLDYRRLQLTPSISIRAYVGSLGHDRLLGAWP